MRIFTGLLPTYCPLNYHFQKLGLATSNVCRLCTEFVETPEHVLAYCETIAKNAVAIIRACKFQAFRLDQENKPQLIIHNCRDTNLPVLFLIG